MTVCAEILATEASAIDRIRLVRQRLGLDLPTAKTLIERVRSGQELSDVQAGYVSVVSDILREEVSEDEEK